MTAITNQINAAESIPHILRTLEDTIIELFDAERLTIYAVDIKKSGARCCGQYSEFDPEKSWCAQLDSNQRLQLRRLKTGSFSIYDSGFRRVGRKPFDYGACCREAMVPTSRPTAARG